MQHPVSEPNLPVSEACLRNQAPIADVLAQELEADAFVLEIGSGTGQHAAYMTRHLPGIKWQPSELAGRLEGINGWRQRSGQVGFLPPLILDVSQDLWPVKQVDAVFSANVVHFIGWPQLRSMMTGIARVLKQGGLALLYGPYNYAGQYTSEGNQRLDQWLREQNPEAGIKDFEQVILAARKEKLRLLKDIAMPANNRMLVLQKY
ncbi:methylase [Bacterioplanes sanyensis]|nr:methylase [Bacterioplanes sanyensis]